MTTGDRMKARRKELGIPVEDIASALGVSVATVYRYEKGDIEKLPGATLEPLAKILRTTPAALMGWEGNEDTSTESCKRVVSDEDIKFALFGDDVEVTDEMYDEVKRFAAYVKAREVKRRAERKNQKPTEISSLIPKSFPDQHLRVASPVMFPTLRKKDEK